jgi:hypothetical protein
MSTSAGQAREICDGFCLSKLAGQELENPIGEEETIGPKMMW